MIRIDHRHDDDLARMGYPWMVVEAGRTQQHFRTHREALQYCLKRMEILADENNASNRLTGTQADTAGIGLP
jgi:hypothetical protein